jgi:predicted alpha/beta-fold hydrolase
VGLPVAGLGPQIRGIPKTIGFLEKVNQHLVQNHFGDTPVIVGGRSMGASKGFLHNLLFHGTGNSADAYFMISYSNPFTMELQIESVLSQVKAGLFSGIIHESLQNASDISNETIALLKKMKAKNPEVFKKFGNNMISFEEASKFE